MRSAMKFLLTIALVFRAANISYRKAFDRYLATSMDRIKQRFIITRESEYSETIKKSKFIAKAYPACSIDEALDILEKVSDPKATHNCWAFNSIDYQRSSDDGEPSGTAGRPILAALTAENVVNALVVCTRYYGGINLGTGGLSRAYGGTAMQALKLAEKELFRPMLQLEIETSSRDMGSIQRLLKPYVILEQKFVDDTFDNELGTRVTVRVRIPDDEVRDVQQKILSSLGGRGKVSVL